MSTLESNFKFSSFCYKVLENLATQIKRKQRESVLLQFWAYLREKGQQDLWPFNRLLFCSLDNERRVYNLQEKKLAHRYISALSIQSNSPLGDALIHYRQPSPLHTSAGDFPAVLEQCLQPRQPSHPSSVTIEEINRYLNLIANGDQHVQVNTFRELLTTISATEHKWLCRIILKDLRLRMRAETMLKLWHPQAVGYLAITNNLHKVLSELHNPAISVDLTCFHAVLFTPLKPELARRAQSLEVYSSFFQEGVSLCVEPKLDGERVQVHVDSVGDVCKFYSRSCLEYSKYSDIVGSFLIDCLDAKSVVIDGELLVYNRISCKFDPFGCLKEVATKGEDSEKQLCFTAFDLLYLNGTSILDKTLSERRTLLKATVKTIPKRIEVISSHTVTTQSELVEQYNQLVARGHEGAIVKLMESQYKPGSRSTDWIKLKPDYEKGELTDIDLAVIGGSFGHQSRAKEIASLHVGVYDASRAKWRLLCRVGGGLTENMRTEITTKMKGEGFSEVTDMDPNTSLLEFGMMQADERPDFICEDIEKTFLVTINSSQIIVSKSYPLGYTLRFPRIVNVRFTGKSVYDCLNLEGFMELVSSTSALEGRLYTGEVVETAETSSILDDSSMTVTAEEGIPPLKQEPVKRTTRKIKKPRASKYDEVRKAMLRRTQIEVVSRLFADHVVLLELRSPEYHNLWGMLLAHGAHVVENPVTDLNFVVIDHPLKDASPRIASIAQNYLDIKFVNPDYFILCIENEQLLPLSPLFLWSNYAVNPGEFDQFGDSFSFSLTPGFLHALFQRGFTKEAVANCVESFNTEPHVLLELKTLFPEHYFFLNVRALLIPFSTSLSLVIETHGGCIVDSLVDCTHVIITEPLLCAPDEIISEASSRRSKLGTLSPLPVITSDWVQQCVKERTIVNEGDYIWRQSEKELNVDELLEFKLEE
ncbi:hypothetical protein P9112_002637 [Eukaryota sp. TZLM1-RC]